MKIKLAILETNDKYLKRLVAALRAKYADEVELYSFTDAQIAIETINNKRISVLIADSTIELDLADINSKCGFAYLVDAPGIEMHNEQRAICRYQKVELIYKQVLSIFAETSNYTATRTSEGIVKGIAFVAPSGGVGCSVAAVACARYLANKGKRVMYLNLEKLGNADCYFSGEGQFDMSDIIFALKSKNANLSYKLQSCMKTDFSGVSFISRAKLALDMMEVGYDDIAKLVAEIKIMDAFDYIVVDLDFSLMEEQLRVYSLFEEVVMVSDGTVIANQKSYRAYEAITMLDQNGKSSLAEKMVIMYNRFSNKTCQMLDGISLREIGGAPRYENATTEQVVMQLAQMTLFEALM